MADLKTTEGALRDARLVNDVLMRATDCLRCQLERFAPWETTAETIAAKLGDLALRIAGLPPGYSPAELAALCVEFDKIWTASEEILLSSTSEGAAEIAVTMADTARPMPATSAELPIERSGRLGLERWYHLVKGCVHASVTDEAVRGIAKIAFDHEERGEPCGAWHATAIYFDMVDLCMCHPCCVKRERGTMQ